MRAIYTIGIQLYYFLVLVTSLFNNKAKLFIQGRKAWKRKLLEKIDTKSKYIWFHCASLGEFEQGRPVIEKVKNDYPEYKIILTFFSPSGYEIRKNYDKADIISYLPLDTPRNVKTFYKLVNPKKIYIVKYEFWFNYFAEAKKRGIPLFVISAIFRKGQLFFKSNFLGKWYRKTLLVVEHFFVQNIESEKILHASGINNVTVSGDSRFDRVAEIASSVKQIPLIEKFKINNHLVIAGSTWQPDEELLIRFINQSENVKFIIAPHEVSLSNVKRIKNAINKPVELFSKLKIQEAIKTDVIIIDSIGILSSLYQYGEIAFIGGGFGVGIHNILEATTFGLPVIFGPNYKKFKEAVELINLGGAFSISKYEDLERILSSFLVNPKKQHKVSALAKNYVEQNTGSTKIIVNRTFGF